VVIDLKKLFLRAVDLCPVKIHPFSGVIAFLGVVVLCP
jgi:hypothetical protein